MGAAVVWLWGREIGEYLGEKTRGVRTKAADGVRAVEEKAGKVLDRTREDVSEALRAGQEAIRPAPAARKG
jgi:hypothetical protein